MRHRKDGRQFGRNTSHRRAMFRNLAANLVNHERIVTTDAKAKELRRVAERLITKAKRLGAVAYTPQAELSNDDKAKRLHVSRLLSAYLPRWGVESDGITKRDLVEKVMVELTKRFSDRAGGYTRIIRIGRRKGDNASMSVIEFIDAAPIVNEEDEAAEDATDVAENTAAAEESTDEESAEEESAEEESTEEESTEEEPDKEEPDKEEPDKEEPDKEEPDKEEPDKEEPDKEEPDKEEPDKEE